MELSEVYSAISRLKGDNQPFAVVTVISSEGSTPRKLGSKMVVLPDGAIIGTIGGGPLEHESAKKAVGAIATGKCERVRFELADLLLACGGAVEVFIEPDRGAERAVIFGGGHIALKLAPLLSSLGFFVIVADDRPEYIGEERFPGCRSVLLKGYEPGDLARSKDEIALTDADYSIIVTRGHEYSDGKVLRFALENTSDFKYIGMIGSRAKVAATMNGLLDAGFSRDRLSAVHAPIGVDTGGETPAEIAVSIAAEILRVKYGRDGCHVRDKKGFFHNQS